MKINEALIIGGSLLAALVLFKGGAASSNNKQFSGKSSVPVLPIENKGPSFQIPQIQTFLQKIRIPSIPTFDQFFPVTDTNVQLKQIVNIEKEKKDQRVSYLQDELDQTRRYITTEQGTAQVDQYNQNLPYRKYNKSKYYLYDSDKQRIAKLTGKEKGDYTGNDIINYYEDLVESESALGYGGSVTGGKFRKYPLITAALTNYYNVEIAKRNITKAEVYADQQQQGINLVEEEYQTRFGGLSRYG
jgi:hypothetical protein